MLYYKLDMLIYNKTTHPDMSVSRSKEIKRIYFKVPDNVDKNALVEALRNACYGCSTYAYMRVDEDEFIYNKNKFGNAFEFDDKLRCIWDNL